MVFHKTCYPTLLRQQWVFVKNLSVFGDDYDTPDGSCIRDYIYVVDLAKAHVIAMDRILNNKQKEKVEVFNIGTGKGVSVLELINTFEKGYRCET